jgi:hypothetical protein
MTISPQQKRGIIVSLPKNNGEQNSDHYRLITPLNTDCKLLLRIIARRLHPVLEEQLQSSEYCFVPGNSVLEAISTVLDVIAHAEVTRTPLCILSLDYQSVFDRLSHQYLFQVLRRYGINLWFIERITSLYENAIASVQINGSTPGTIPFRVPSGKVAHLA